MEIIKLELGSLGTNCYILINGNNAILIDPADEPNIIKEALSNYNLLAVLITHYHYDHIGALPYFKDYPIYDIKKEEGDYQIDNFTFKIIKTPGHKDDCVTFMFDDNLFTGDFIFKETIGRTDLEGANHKDMLKSLEKLKKLSTNFNIYPGHGPSTTLDHELKYNYFLK